MATDNSNSIEGDDDNDEDNEDEGINWASYVFFRERSGSAHPESSFIQVFSSLPLNCKHSL